MNCNPSTLLVRRSFLPALPLRSPQVRRSPSAPALAFRRGGLHHRRRRRCRASRRRGGCASAKRSFILVEGVEPDRWTLIVDSRASAFRSIAARISFTIRTSIRWRKLAARTTGLDVYPAPSAQRIRIGRRNAREGELEDYCRRGAGQPGDRRRHTSRTRHRLRQRAAARPWRLAVDGGICARSVHQRRRTSTRCRRWI